MVYADAITYRLSQFHTSVISFGNLKVSVLMSEDNQKLVVGLPCHQHLKLLFQDQSTLMSFAKQSFFSVTVPCSDLHWPFHVASTQGK